MKQQLIIVCICCLVAGCGGSKGAATATGAPASDGSNSASAAAPAGAGDDMMSQLNQLGRIISLSRFIRSQQPRMIPPDARDRIKK